MNKSNIGVKVILAISAVLFAAEDVMAQQVPGIAPGQNDSQVLGRPVGKDRVAGIPSVTIDSAVSPDGKVSVSLFEDDDHGLRYTIDFKGTRVIEPSSLGITVDGVDLASGVVLHPPRVSRSDVTYATRGHHGRARNHYGLWSFPVTHQGSGRDYSIEFRVYQSIDEDRQCITDTARANSDDGCCRRHLGELVAAVEPRFQDWDGGDGLASKCCNGLNGCDPDDSVWIVQCIDQIGQCWLGLIAHGIEDFDGKQA